MFTNVTVRALAAALALALVAACSSGDDADDAAPAEAASAENDEAGTSADPGPWVVEAPEDHGLDPATLEEARTYAFADGRNTQGVVVVRDGVIVAEWYADGAGPDSWVASWSVAKSFASATVGIAIEEGKIPGVDEPMTTWYPEFAGTEREDMTLENVLQMGSGLDWVEDYDPDASASSDIIRMVTGERDQLAYAASQPAEVAPGTRWSYSSGDTMLLSGVIEQATGMPADAVRHRGAVRAPRPRAGRVVARRRGPHAHLLLLRLDQPRLRPLRPALPAERAVGRRADRARGLGGGLAGPRPTPRRRRASRTATSGGSASPRASTRTCSRPSATTGSGSTSSPVSTWSWCATART